MTFTFQDILQFSNVAILPVFVYIVVLERRITKLQTQVEILIKQLGGRK